MNKKWRRWLWVAGVTWVLGLGAVANAQNSTFQPFKGLFGSRTAPEPKTQQNNRATEIQVELAWMSDQTTCPYYLEAHIKGSTLELRGYVPSKAIRDQAVSLAKMNCPLPVTDSMKEHPSLAVRPANRAPNQLKSAAQTALREAYPGQNLTVQCQSDGTIEVSGSVRSLEQKLTVSQALRRLHGCTRVTNLTQTSDGAIVQQAMPAAKTASPTDTTAPEQKRGGLFAIFNKPPPPAKQANPFADKIVPVDPPAPKIQTVSSNVPKTPAQSKPGAPYESRGVVVVANEEPTPTKAASPPDTVVPVSAPAASTPKTAVPGTSLTAAQLKKRIEGAVPGVRNVTVTFTSKTDVQVECTPRNGDDSGAVAGQILSLRELDAYKVNLQIQLPDVEKK